MILLNRYLLIFFLSLSIISCGGSSSYPTTDTSSGGNDGGTTPNDPDSTSDVLSLDADCAYYGLAAATSNGQCLEYGSSTTFDLSDLSGGSQKTISSRFDVDDTSNGFAGANNVLQIAEAKALLTKLGIAHDGSSQNIAILGSGFNDVAAFNTSGKSYNYGYLNNSGDIKGASASGNIEFKTLYNNLEEVEKYSIFTKNTFEAFSPEQDFTSSNSANFYYDDNTQPVLNSSKAKISSSQIATYIYDVSSTDTDVVFASNHITSLANYFDDKQGTFGTGTGVLDYDNVLNQNDEALCASNDCTRNYHVFLSEDYSGSFYEYQTSIFEYGHNDVANGSALASIIGATDSSNIQGQATGAIMNSYKTQIYHRKLLDVSSGSFISDKNQDYMDSILEDNTGTILYNALNDARQNNKIILLNNQYRNYKSQFYINTDAVSIEAKTNFQLSYDTATDPSQLDGYTEVDFYRFSNNTNYSLNSYSVSKDEDIGTFVGGNFVDSSTKNLVNNDISSYNSLTDYDIFKKSNHDYGDSGTYKYLTDTNLNTAATTSVNNIKDLINSNSNGVNNIYIIPTDNKFFIDLVNVLSTDYNQVKNLITVSDVQVKDITYAENDSIDYDNDNEEDYNGLYEIDSIEVDSKISDNDCSVITNSNTACFIAPGNVASLNNSGEYTAYDDLDIDGVNKYQNTNVLNNHGAKDGIDQGEYLGSAYVTSAVAILTGAFPSVELYNIVTKLKDTAISASDIRGCDEDGESGTINCGNGMINLFKAVQPLYSESQTSSAFSHIDSPAIHTNSVVDDFVYDLADTSISSSLYFGDALINNTEDIFAKAQYFDSYNFNYNASLASKVSASKDLLVSRYAASDLFEFDNKFETKSENIPLANNISFTVTSTKLKNNDVSKVVRVFEDPEIEIANAEFSNLKFNQTIYQNVDIEFGFDSYSNEFDIINNNYANFGALSFVASNQYAGLLGDEVAYSQLKLNLSNKINSYIGFATSAENDSDYIFSKFNYDLGNSYISFSLGTLLENDNFLGTEAEGSFNVNEGSKTTYYGLGYVKNFANNIDFISKLDFGITKIKSDNYSVFKNFSDVSSREASFALVKRYKNSAYGIAYSEPMRVVSGDVLVSVGTARDEDGNVTLASENVSLISSGKERNYELFYKKNLPTNDSISFNFIYTEEPNHIASNPDDQLFALKYSKSF